MRTPIITFLCLAAAACGRQSATAAPPPPITFDGGLATDKAAMVRHGERLTWVLGCTGCHGANLEGHQFEPQATQYGPIYASNLTVEVPEYNDAQLERIIRHGIHPERKTVWVMPSEIFQHLSDDDYRALVAYLRSLKPIGQKLPPPQFSPQDRKDIASGLYKPAVEKVPEFARSVPVDLGSRYALGRYITEVTCAECHGSSLGGDSTGTPKTPDLIVASGYSRGDFERLLTQGIPTGGRKLDLMAAVGRGRMSHLTSHERDAVYAYLKARAEQPQ